MPGPLLLMNRPIGVSGPVASKISMLVTSSPDVSRGKKRLPHPDLQPIRHHRVPRVQVDSKIDYLHQDSLPQYRYDRL